MTLTREREPAALVSKPARADDAIAFEGVSKTYRAASGEVHALQDVSFGVPRGRILGVIGRSGAGKSSLLRTVNGLETPSAGRVVVDGRDVGRLDAAGLVALRRRVGMVFQHFNLLSAKMVRDNIALPLLVAGAGKAEIAARVAEVVALTGLEGKERSYPARLSGGQKQRVGIARALAPRPDILLCDEATSALDPETTLSILRLLKDINRRLGLTIVLITHEMSVIREICDEVVVLERGRVAERGPVWRVFGDPRHPATQALLRPLSRELPDDIAARLTPQPESVHARALVELVYTGASGLTPDAQAISQAFGGPTTVLQSALDFIQGHVAGRLVVVGPARRARDAQAFAPLADQTRILGYVAADV